MRGSSLKKSRRRGMALFFVMIAMTVLSVVTYTFVSRLAGYSHRQNYFISYQKSRYAASSATRYAVAKLRRIEPSYVDRTGAPDFSDMFALDQESYGKMMSQWAQQLFKEMYIEDDNGNLVLNPWLARAENNITASEKRENIKAVRKARKTVYKDIQDSGLTPEDYTPEELTDMISKEYETETGLPLTNEMLLNALGNSGGSRQGGNPDDMSNIAFAPVEPANDSYAQYEETNSPSWEELANGLEVPGPYGPAWPMLTEPETMDFGDDCTVEITIEDENAKLPAVLALLKERGRDYESEKEACFYTFFEWMGADEDQIKDFMDTMDFIAKTKTYNFHLKPIKITEKKPVTTRRSKSRSRSSRRKKSTRYRTVTTNRSVYKHRMDFAMLFNNYVDKRMLKDDIVGWGLNGENALKYLGLWGSYKVNINTAPRNVLEAVFSFGGDGDQIANGIIERRMEKPFKSIKELKEVMYGYTDSIDKVKEMLTTESILFTIRVRAKCGNAVTESISTVIKARSTVRKIATITY